MLQNIYLLFMPSEFVIIGPVLLFEPIFPYNIYFSREVLAGRTGPPPHAARAPQVGHPWFRQSDWTICIPVAVHLNQ